MQRGYHSSCAVNGIMATDRNCGVFVAAAGLYITFYRRVRLSTGKCDEQKMMGIYPSIYYCAIKWPFEYHVLRSDTYSDCARTRRAFYKYNV